MSGTLELDISKSALLVMDYQVGGLANWAGGSQESLLERTAEALGAARRSGLRLIDSEALLAVLA